MDYNADFLGLSIDTAPEYTRNALEQSLNRLGVSFIDLYYIHRLDGKTPIEKTVEVLAELKRQALHRIDLKLVADNLPR